jgi:transcriptional regulator with XRE-family HTH domain
VVIDPKEVNERVTFARLSLGLTRPEFARLTGVGLRTLEAWDAGHTEPSLKCIRRIATATDRPVAWFLGLDEAELGIAS